MLRALDDFARADAADLGGNWANKRNAPGIFSNAVDISTVDDHVAYYAGKSLSDDQWAQGRAVVAAAASRCIGLGVRLSSAADRTGYYGGFDQNNSDGNRRLWKWVSTTLTSLASEAVTVAANDVIYVEVRGSTLKLFINGTERLSTTDASHTYGFAGLTVSNGAGDVALLDDWSAGDFLAAASGRPRSPNDLALTAEASDGGAAEFVLAAWF